MRIMIIVEGGCIQTIVATAEEDLSIYIIDHDNLKVEADALELAYIPQQPDCVCDDEGFDVMLKESLEEYEEKERRDGESTS